MVESTSVEASSQSNKLWDLLTTAREQKKLSLMQVSEWLKVPEKTLKIFESEGLELKNLDSFQRGYLRNYANLLDVNLDAFQHEFPKQVEMTSRMQSIHPEIAPLIKLNLKWVFKVLGIVLVIGVVVLVFAGFN